VSKNQSNGFCCEKGCFRFGSIDFAEINRAAADATFGAAIKPVLLPK
jgi:hypothetical protein